MTEPATAPLVAGEQSCWQLRPKRFDDSFARLPLSSRRSRHPLGRVGGLVGGLVVLAAGACGGRTNPASDAARVTTTAAGPTSPAAAPTVPTTAPEVRDDPGVGEDPGVVVTPTGVVAPVVRRTTAGWVVRTPCGNEVMVGRAMPVGRVDVVVDPGHGGDERGAVGPNGLAEADLNLAVARRVAESLAARGFSALLTRSTDLRMTLATRAEIVVQARPRAFVSVHHNTDPDGPASRPGTETFYQFRSGDSKRLAGLIYEEVVAALGRYAVPWVADTDAGAKYRLNSRGEDYYGILRRTAGVPAVLAELAYLSNPPEAALLVRPEVQRAEGEAVARGVIRFLTTADPGSGYAEPYPRRTPAGSGGGSGGCIDPPLS